MMKLDFLRHRWRIGSFMKAPDVVGRCRLRYRPARIGDAIITGGFVAQRSQRLGAVNREHLRVQTARPPEKPTGTALKRLPPVQKKGRDVLASGEITRKQPNSAVPNP